MEKGRIDILFANISLGKRRVDLLASRDLAPTFPVTYRLLAACYAHMGRLDKAREIVTRLRAISPAVMEPGTRYRNTELRELFLSGLRLAASLRPRLRRGV